MVDTPLIEDVVCDPDGDVLADCVFRVAVFVVD